MSTVPESVSIFRRAERGADLITQLLLFEYRQIRASVAKLYSPVPRKVRRLYRRIEADAQKKQVNKIQKEHRTLNEILQDPNASDEYKRLARMELVILEDPQAAQRAQE